MYILTNQTLGLIKSKTFISTSNVKVLELDELPGQDGPDIQATLNELTNQSTVPSIWINGKFIGGSSDLAALESKGQLDPLLQQQ